ncbi:MAG: multicopper oxidase family protein [Nocardioidaceae bacterium]|nr:multicopper oxidase family protein [Nocardioidaceae bacterium]
MPSTYSVMDMGYVDYGGGPRGSGDDGHDGHDGHDMHDRAGATSVADLTERSDRAADVTVDLVARQGTVTVAGREIDGYSLNGRTPGPTIEVTQGRLLEVRLHNRDVEEGITLHWHGVDVPNAEDGVAGVTQDAVQRGEEHVYRFVARDAGTYWYHSHQVSHEQVRGGLFGTLVVQPRRAPAGVVDVPAVMHTYDSLTTVNGTRTDHVTARPGQRVRVRVVNPDNGPFQAWASAPYRVLAVDGTDVHGPTPVEDEAVTVTAGGRVDLSLTVPADGLRVQLGSAAAVVVGREGAEVPEPDAPGAEVDLLSYGAPAPLGFDPADADRSFRYAVGRRPGFVKGRPGLFWTVNGHLFPDVPMFVVREGDVVRMTISNSSGDVHPMHLHGHHAVVVSRDGRRATGSPWWFDSLDVEDGETYEVAFVADNPGVWMDHCHNLEHARDGLVAHLMYDGVRTPYRVGGAPGNEPE